MKKTLIISGAAAAAILPAAFGLAANPSLSAERPVDRSSVQLVDSSSRPGATSTAGAPGSAVGAGTPSVPVTSSGGGTPSGRGTSSASASKAPDDHGRRHGGHGADDRNTSTPRSSAGATSASRTGHDVGDDHGGRGKGDDETDMHRHRGRSDGGDDKHGGGHGKSDD